MTTPVRIQRTRKKDFNLQAASPNGLPVVYVGRPTKWGNGFNWRKHQRDIDPTLTDREARQAVVETYREFVLSPESHIRLIGNVPSLEEIQELRGKNLACWCPLDSPCHADLLLELANGAQGDLSRAVEGG